MRTASNGSRTVRKITLCAMLMSLSVVIGIICKNWFTIGVYYRVTFENFPVIIAGFLFGPLWGAAVGAGADVVSCLLSTNPAVNFVITIGAATVGLLSGLVPLVFRRARVPFSLKLALSVASAHLIGQVAIKSIGKIMYFGMPVYGIFIGLGISAVVGTAEFFFIRLLLSNSEIASHLADITDNLPGKRKEDPGK